MKTLNRRDQVLVYGMAGSDKRLLDASLYIWNLVGLAALAAIGVWLFRRAQEMAPTGSGLGERLSTGTGRTAPAANWPKAPRANQMEHAHFVTGNTTSEDILAHQLEQYQAIERQATASKQRPATLPGAGEGGAGTKAPGEGKR